MSHLLRLRRPRLLRLVRRLHHLEIRQGQCKVAMVSVEWAMVQAAVTLSVGAAMALGMTAVTMAADCL